MPATFLNLINAIAPLAPTEQESLLPILHENVLTKGDYLIREGKPTDAIAFIRRGYLRKFYLKDGREETDAFYFDNEFCADLPSILGHYPPDANVVAMEDTQVITFSYSDFHTIARSSVALQHVYRVLLEQVFLRFYRRTRSFVLQTPKERYESILKQEPHLLQKVTQYHIASYIGISYQHLSRLRAAK